MSHPSDAAASEAIAAHHVELSGEIRRRVEALEAAARAGGPYEDARAVVLEYLDRELLPHAAAEERALYPSGNRGGTELLVRAMLGEHLTIVDHVNGLRTAEDAIGATSQASAVLALFESHLTKENDYLIPALVADPDVDLGALLDGMHELVG